MKSKSWKEKIWICGNFPSRFGRTLFWCGISGFMQTMLISMAKSRSMSSLDDDKGHEVGIKDVDFLLYYVAAWENNDWMLTLDFADFKER